MTKRRTLSFHERRIPFFYIKNVGCIHIWKKAYPEKHQGSMDRWCNVRKAKNVGLRRKCSEYLQTLVVVGWSGATILVGPTTLGASPSESCMLKIYDFRIQVST